MWKFGIWNMCDISGMVQVKRVHRHYFITTHTVHIFVIPANSIARHRLISQPHRCSLNASHFSLSLSLSLSVSPFPVPITHSLTHSIPPLPSFPVQPSTSRSASSFRKLFIFIFIPRLMASYIPPPTLLRTHCAARGTVIPPKPIPLRSNA